MEVVPNDRPPDVWVQSIEVDAGEVSSNWERYGEVLCREQLLKEVAGVRAIYKRKGKKVNPVDVPLAGGVSPGGGVNSGGLLQEGEKSGIQEDWEPWRRSGTVVARGSRLTP